MSPRKRVLALAFLAGVVAVSAALAGRSHTGAAAALAASGGKTPTGTTIHLLEDEVQPTAVPIGRHTGLAAGDEAVYTRTLRTMQKKPIGQLNISCVATRGGQNSISLCTGVYTLASGTLVGTTIGRSSQGSPNTLHIAVTGGTGRFEGARGSILSAGSRTGFANDTIHLLP
jgi:hypothetical protein